MIPVYRPLGTFRLVLALMVLVSHTHRLGGPALDWLKPLGLGNPAVMTFFVLSGFVIAEALSVFYRGRPGAFLINRFLRIHPPFFVALVLSIGVHLALRDSLVFFDPVTTEGMFGADNILANSLRLIVLYGHGWLGVPPTSYVFVRPDWAVAIEVQFYLMIAAFSLFGGRRYWTAVCVALLTAFVVSMQTRWLYGSGWIPYFILGVAMFHRQRLLALVCVLLVNWHAATYIARDPEANVIAAVAILDILIVVLWVLGQASAGKWKRLDTFLGDLTYPIYLNHYTVGIAALTLLSPGFGTFAATFVAAIAFSYVAMLLTEPVTKKLRNRFRGQALT